MEQVMKLFCSSKLHEQRKIADPVDHKRNDLVREVVYDDKKKIPTPSPCRCQPCVLDDDEIEHKQFTRIKANPSVKAILERSKIKGRTFVFSGSKKIGPTIVNGIQNGDLIVSVRDVTKYPVVQIEPNTLFADFATADNSIQQLVDNLASKTFEVDVYKIDQ